MTEEGEMRREKCGEKGTLIILSLTIVYNWLFLGNYIISEEREIRGEEGGQA